MEYLLVFVCVYKYTKTKISEWGREVQVHGKPAGAVDFRVQRGLTGKNVSANEEKNNYLNKKFF